MVRPIIRVRRLSSCRKTMAISSSFQTQSAWTVTTVTSAGPESGRTIAPEDAPAPRPVHPRRFDEGGAKWC